MLNKTGKYSSSIKQLTKKHENDAGLDIASVEECFVPANGHRAVSTDLKVEIPHNHVGIIKPRSGLAFKHQIDTGAGVIDSGYRGEVKVLLFNHSNKEYKVEKGERIAQLLTLPCKLTRYKRVDEINKNTNRKEDGFGSSGRINHE